MRAILTSPTGIRSHVGWVIDVLIDYGNFEDYTDKQITREITRLGQKLEQVAGPMAPAVILLAVEQYVPKAYSVHVAALWRLNDIDEATINEDGIPTLAISGEPPGRRRAAG